MSAVFEFDLIIYHSLGIPSRDYFSSSFEICVSRHSFENWDAVEAMDEVSYLSR